MDAHPANASAALASSTSQLAAPAPIDVETTNWNAVKILAVQHDIPLALLESIRDTVTADPTADFTSHDFGLTTPLEITAVRLDSGRVGFRFRSRRPDPAAAATTLSPQPAKPLALPALQHGIPRSSSSGAVWTPDPSDPTPIPAKTNLSAGLFRRTGNLSLKHSKSIPVLRRKASGVLAPFAASEAPNATQAAEPSPDHAPAARHDHAASLLAPALPITSPHKSAAAQNPADRLHPYRFAGAPALMARTGSSPVNGPHANRYATDHIEEGDVLGAILGLGHADLWAKALPDAQVAPQHRALQPQSRRRRSSSSSSAASRGLSASQLSPPQLRLPELSLDPQTSSSPRVHQLREAQSFESAVSDATARGDQNDPAIDQYPLDLQPLIQTQDGNSSRLNDKTLIFDVLQCYHRPSPSSASQASGSVPRSHRSRLVPQRDLASSEPNLDRRAALEDSPASDFLAQAQALPTSASPGDDPRFAVWAVKGDTNDGSFVVCNRFGHTEHGSTLSLNSPSSTTTSPASTTKRRNRKSQLPFGSSSDAQDATPERNAQSTQPKPMLLAASASRLVAELTAEIDLRLRNDFFYTYRAFMTPLDLLELLILRFEWAISDPTSAEDEARRRIVRVRTYVVIKHWLQHHFDSDFLPNRALRQRLAAWLNAMAKDERITSRPADMNIVNSLRKIVRALKQTYSQSGVGGLLLNDAGRLADSTPVRRKTDSLSTFASSSHDSASSSGKHMSVASNDEHALSSSSSVPSTTEDVNLDFSEDNGSHDAPHVRSPSSDHQQQSPAAKSSRMDSPGSSLAARKAAAESVLVSHRHTLAPATFLPPRAAASSNSSSPAPMPHPSNAWSRAFVHTVGRLSKFKRVLGNRGIGMDSANDLEAEAEQCHDLLFAKGGLESLLQYFAIEQARRQSSSAMRQTTLPRQRPLSRTEEANEDEEEGGASQMSEDSTGQEETPSLAGASTNRSTPASSIDLTALSEKRTSISRQDGRGLGIHNTDKVAPHPAALDAHDPLALDASFIRPLDSFVKRSTKNEEPLHHATSEQTLRSVSRAPYGRGSEDSISAGRASIEHDSSASRKQHGMLSRGPSMRASVMSNGAPRIVQIDDIDLSSDDDDFAVRKALRRLPGARDLRQANNIRDLEPPVSQGGRESFDSMASSVFRHPAATRQVYIGSFSRGHVRGLSVDSALHVSDQLLGSPSALPPAPPMISTVQSEMLDPDEALQGYELVKGFRLDDIESDDEEPGDVEAALRRLEGIIDEDRQKQKANRVERLWQRSLARNARADDADGKDEAASLDKRASQMSTHSRADRTLSSSLTGGSLADAEDEASNASMHPCERSYDEVEAALAGSASMDDAEVQAQSSFLDLQESRSASEAEDHATTTQPPAGALASAAKPVEGKTAPAAVHFTGPGAAASKSAVAADRASMVAGLQLSPGRSVAPLPPVHRSFLLSYRSESVARQMCLIEAELLRSVTWDELASSRWRERRFGSEVTDWEAFYRDRVRDRLEAQRLGEVHEERAVEAIVARFNLTSNWVASEVVLTQNIDERAAVICKLIRIAWKCYLQSNFASLAQIIFGLSTPWVERLRRTWNRVGYFEMRMWKDLNSFVGPRNNFRHLRNAMLQLADGASGIGGNSASGTAAGGSGVAEGGSSASNRGCIPFFGLFVSDLMQCDAMPTLLDPTSPTAAATVTTRQDGKMRLLPAEPGAFAHLAPLPPSVQLEPLVNVLKFRSIAEVIRQVSAFQSAAKNYAAMFEAEKGAYVRCLKLRCLPGELLARLSHMIEA
ncbi:hypothetical protein PaG_00173 [Moesziomyces aphidis]|uniref:Ras GEF n=1 Tax=Moesziomyces aphidis TaxID=84754 RepID=W3VV72_MOEAP|nr:hypothetical protein PaG_00173 [Moesziomyces aphidis]